MSEEDFDKLVSAAIEEIRPHIEGKPWEAAIWALAELIMAGVESHDEIEYIRDVFDEIGCPVCEIQPTLQ